jgi:Dihydrodipicolinate synthetase family
LITPWRDDRLDETSLRRLVRYYASEPVDGLILAATTGEGLTLEGAETEQLVDVAAEAAAVMARPLPMYLGLSGSFARQVVTHLARTERWAINGYLITCPYSTRPAQDGLYAHFATLADATARPLNHITGSSCRRPFRPYQSRPLVPQSIVHSCVSCARHPRFPRPFHRVVDICRQRNTTGAMANEKTMGTCTPIWEIETVCCSKMSSSVVESAVATK